MSAVDKGRSKYIKLLLYLVVIILLNVAGVTLYFRGDMTKNHVYSLSDVSKKVVSTLTEPLTIPKFQKSFLHGVVGLFLIAILVIYKVENGL